MNHLLLLAAILILVTVDLSMAREDLTSSQLQRIKDLKPQMMQSRPYDPRDTWLFFKRNNDRAERRAARAKKAELKRCRQMVKKWKKTKNLADL
ncbi:hypothetical protein HDE_03128 [Halotydeus destructor]|nr:hypothetical protein HDE_03128 [Halotydeus destructor]